MKKIKKKKQAEIISLEEYRSKNIALIKSADEIEKHLTDDKKWSLAAGFFVPANGGEAVFMATSTLNPLEAAGLSLGIALQCTQRSDFKDSGVSNIKKDKTSENE